jgi:hypothetical protein
MEIYTADLQPITDKTFSLSQKILATPPSQILFIDSVGALKTFLFSGPTCQLPRSFWFSQKPHFA